jgi:tripartite-type tricarboxylate transporter receptor subunit TctC
MLKSFMAMVFLLFFSVAAWAWPTQNINLIVPFAPGGLADQITRIVADDLREQLGATVVVSNVPGVDGLVAMKQQLANKDDGHTFMFVTDSYVVGPWFIDNDVVKQYNLTQIIGTVPLVLVGPPNSDLAALRAKTDVNVGVVGLDSAHNAWLQGLRGATRFNSVPYKGANQVMTDLMGGHVDYAVVSLAFSQQYAQDGRAKVLMLSLETTAPTHPNVPTFRAAGFSGRAATHWYGFVTRSPVNESHVQKFNALVQDIIKNNAKIDAIRQQGVSFNALGTAKSQEILAQEIKFYTQLRAEPKR